MSTPLQLTAAACLAAALAAPAAAAPAAEPFDERQKAALGQIIHDYLVTHPEVLIEASQALEQRQSALQERARGEAVAYFTADPGTPHRRGRGGNYLIEFFDYNCGYCKKARVHTQQLIAEHDMDAYYIEYPILSNASVQAAAIGLALYRSEPERYFAYQNLLMGRSARVEGLEDVRSALQEVGADAEAVITRAREPDIQEALVKNLELGKKMGVMGTPYFIINDQAILGGFASAGDLERYLRR